MTSIPVTPAVIRVLREDRERAAARVHRHHLAREARGRPGDARANRPISAWSSLLIAVRLRPVA
jgi:hypothetical protein